MVLHESIHVKTFTSYGVPCKGLFVKDDFPNVITKGTIIWKYEPSQNEIIRTYTKHDILHAPTTAMTMSQVIAIMETPKLTTTKTSTDTLTTFDSTISTMVDTTVSSSFHSTTDVLLENPKEALITYSYMIDDDCYASTPDPTEDISYYYNHSCEPNTGYQNDHTIVAIRDIYPGEQVVYDYAFTETQDSCHYNMICHCHSTSCRGTLNFLQYKNPTYIENNYQYCTSFIQRKMMEHGWVHNQIVRRHIRLNSSDGTTATNPSSLQSTMASSSSFGLYTKQAIPSDTVVIIFAGKIVTGEHVSQLTSSRDQELSLQIDNNLWQIPNRMIRNHNNIMSHTNHGKDYSRIDDTSNMYTYETGDYINHSCQPNCGMMESCKVITLRNIKMNEQITIDYAMINNGTRSLHGDTFTCNCGQFNCRGTISGNDYQKISHDYVDYLSPFVKLSYMNMLSRNIDQHLSITTPSSSTTTSSSNSSSGNKSSSLSSSSSSSSMGHTSLSLKSKSSPESTITASSSFHHMDDATSIATVITSPKISSSKSKT